MKRIRAFISEAGATHHKTLDLKEYGKMSAITPALSWDILDQMFSVKSPVSRSPQNGVVSSDISIDAERSLWFRLYVPSSSSSAAAPITTKLPVVVYYHGGGFRVWSPDCKPYDDLCRALAAESPAVVVSVNYRLAPEHRCPTQYEDGFEALRFLDHHASRSLFGFPGNADLGKCILAGDSAGGNLAHHVAVRASECEDFQIWLETNGSDQRPPEFLAEGHRLVELPEPIFVSNLTDRHSLTQIWSIGDGSFDVTFDAIDILSYLSLLHLHHRNQPLLAN